MGFVTIVWTLWRCGDKDDVAKTELRSFADGGSGPKGSLPANFARKLLDAPSKPLLTSTGEGEVTNDRHVDRPESPASSPDAADTSVL